MKVNRETAVAIVGRIEADGVITEQESDELAALAKNPDATPWGGRLIQEARWRAKMRLEDAPLGIWRTVRALAYALTKNPTELPEYLNRAARADAKDLLSMAQAGARADILGRDGFARALKEVGAPMRPVGQSAATDVPEPDGGETPLGDRTAYYKIGDATLSADRIIALYKEEVLARPDSELNELDPFAQFKQRLTAAMGR